MNQQDVLTLLRTQLDEYITEEQISRQLEISPTEAANALNALRAGGYRIEKTGHGYRLAGEPDLLTEPEIRSHLGTTEWVGHDLLCFEELDSTNTYAKKIARNGAADGTVVVADCQTAGRGRKERSFQSPKGQGVYLTVLLRPELPPAGLLPVTALCAVAVSRAVERVCAVRPQIKWTNDLVLNGKKICGILTEMSVNGETGNLQYLVMGMGVNVCQRREDFSPDVQTKATSLSAELNRPVSRSALAAAEIEELDKLYLALQNGHAADYLEIYRANCITLGREVQILRADGSREHVTALDIDDQFGLVVRRDNGEITVIRSGEASVRGMYGYAE